MAGCEEQKEGIKTPMRKMVDRALIYIVKQGHLDPILVHHVDMLANFSRVMDAPMRRVIENISFIAQILMFAWREVDKTTKKSIFRKY